MILPNPTLLPIMEPMLLAERVLPTAQSGWSYEVKWDGHRSIAYLDGQHPARLVARSGRDMTSRHPEVSVALLEQLRGVDVILDGELVCFGADGRPSFQLMQSRCAPYSDKPRRGAASSQYVAFDVLWFCGKATTGWSYEARRALLCELPLAAPEVLVPPSWDDAEPALDWTRSTGLEGIVAKRNSASYLPGQRSSHWIKYRHKYAL